MSYLLRAPILASSVLSAGLALAAESAKEVRATTLSYDLDAALTYIDAARRPAPAMIARPEPAPAAIEQPRVLGLKHLKLRVHWATIDGPSFSLVLRPDAANHAQAADAGSPVRETDTRSGDPYRPMPTVRLLDAYHLTIKPGTSLDLALGVFEELIADQGAYPEVLGFGLDVEFPAKFSAMRVHYQQSAKDPATAVSAPSGLHADVYVIQGDDDRAEAQGGRDQSFDKAPVGRDPYYGAAVQFGWVAGPRFELNLLGGYGDSSVAGGRRNEVYMEAAATTLLPVLGRDLKIVLDVKDAREKWKGEELSIVGREQRSAALTTSIVTVPGFWYLLGGRFGASDRPLSETEQDEKRAVKGFLVETGFLSRVGKGLTLEFMVNQEKRTTTDAGGDEVGAFVDDDGDHGSLRRLGLTLRYEGNG